MSHRSSQKLHAYKRFRQRYGGELGREAYDHLVGAIKANPDGENHGRSVLLKKINGHRSIWAVKRNGGWLPVVFDRQNETIVTFLPPGAIFNYLDKLQPARRVRGSIDCPTN